MINFARDISNVIWLHRQWHGTYTKSCRNKKLYRGTGFCDKDGVLCCTHTEAIVLPTQSTSCTEVKCIILDLWSIQWINVEIVCNCLFLYLFELDFWVDVDITDFAVKHLILQARAFCDGGLDLELSPWPGIGFDGPCSIPRLQHRFVLGTW